MFLLVSSQKDIASINIKNRVLEQASFENFGSFQNSPVYKNDSFLLITIETELIYAEELDKAVKNEFGAVFDTMVFLSRHSSESKRRTLSVHHVGNFGNARFGGRDGTLPPPAAGPASQALRTLVENYTGDDFVISMEATHHGPYLQTPSFFIEIGSDQDAWAEREPAEAIAKTVLSLKDGGWEDLPTIVGVGGGHYAPRHTDVVRRNMISMGHIAPNYALEQGNERIGMITTSTPRTRGVYFHRKAIPKARYRELRAYFESRGVPALREADLENLNP